MPYKNKISKNKNYREWYAIPENKVKVREYAWRMNWGSKIAVLELYGWKCNQCGFSDWRALQIDHKNGNGAEERRERGHNLYSFCRRVLENPENYQLLCANCNWIKRYTHKEASTIEGMEEKVNQFLEGKRGQHAQVDVLLGV